MVTKRFIVRTTVLTGYAFINDSNRKAEALLWYAIIIGLTIFTTNNVAMLANRYQSRPTKAEVRITSNAMDATIGNFTIKLKLPVTEIQSHKALAFWYDYSMPFFCSQVSCSCFDLEAQSDSFNPSICLPMHLTSLIKSYKPGYVPDFLDYRRDRCKIPSDPLNRSFTGIVETKRLMQILDGRFSKELSSIWSKIAINEEGDNSSFVEKFSNGRQDFNALMDETLEQNFLTPFLLLKIMSDESIANYLPFIELFDATDFFQFSALSPKETLDAISSRLFDIAPFVLAEAVSDTEIFIRDWNVDFADQKIHLDLENNETMYREFGSDFTIEFQVRPPDGVHEFSMAINPPKQLIKLLFPFMHMDSWLYDLLLTRKIFWRALFNLKMDKEQQEICSIIYHFTACDIKDWDDLVDFSMSEEQLSQLTSYFATPRSDFLENYVFPAIEYYKEHSELELKLGSGIEHVTLKPFYRYRINQLPIGRVVSQTDDCISIKLGTCLDLCQSNYTIENCKCYPWNLHYLHTLSNIAICLEPCPGLTAEKVQCIRKCEQFMAHPCDHFIYRPEIDQIPIAGLAETYDFEMLNHAIAEEFKLFNFTITIERVMTYVKTLESYEMSFTNFISDLGGLVDFWLGVNLIGIIHAFVHFLKQCCHCNREHKTGLTIRRLMPCINDKSSAITKVQDEYILKEVRANVEQGEIGIPPDIEAMVQQKIDRCLIQIDKNIEEKIVKEIAKLKETKETLRRRSS